MAPSDSSHIIRALLQHTLTVLDQQPGTALHLGDRQLDSTITADDFELTEARSQARGWEKKYFEMVEKYTALADRVLALPERPEIMDAQHPDPQEYLHGYKVAIRDAKQAVKNPPTTIDQEQR